MNLGIETETLEFKKSTGELKEAMHSICAILNKHQYGELYFGVKNDGTVIGQVVTEESLREVSQKIKNFIEPRIYPEINKVVLDGRDCIHVKFSGDQRPYFAMKIWLCPEKKSRICFSKVGGKVIDGKIWCQIKRLMM